MRHRAKLLVDLIQDDEQLRIERKKAKTEGKEKYQGFSKEDMRIRGGNIGFGIISSFLKKVFLDARKYEKKEK